MICRELNVGGLRRGSDADAQQVSRAGRRATAPEGGKGSRDRRTGRPLPTMFLLGFGRLDNPCGRIYLINDLFENDRPAAPKAVLHVDRCLSCLSGMTTCPFGFRTATLTAHAAMPVLAFWL